MKLNSSLKLALLLSFICLVIILFSRENHYWNSLLPLDSAAGKEICRAKIFSTPNERKSLSSQGQRLDCVLLVFATPASRSLAEYATYFKNRIDLNDNFQILAVSKTEQTLDLVKSAKILLIRSVNETFLVQSQIYPKGPVPLGID